MTLGQHDNADAVGPCAREQLHAPGPRSIGLHSPDIVLERLHPLPMVVDAVPKLRVALSVFGHVGTGLRTNDRGCRPRLGRIGWLKSMGDTAVEG